MVGDDQRLSEVSQYASGVARNGVARKAKPVPLLPLWNFTAVYWPCIRGTEADGNESWLSYRVGQNFSKKTFA